MNIEVVHSAPTNISSFGGYPLAYFVECDDPTQKRLENDLTELENRCLKEFTIISATPFDFEISIINCNDDPDQVGALYYFDPLSQVRRWVPPRAGTSNIFDLSALMPSQLEAQSLTLRYFIQDETKCYRLEIVDPETLSPITSGGLLPSKSFVWDCNGVLQPEIAGPPANGTCLRSFAFNYHNITVRLTECIPTMRCQPLCIDWSSAGATPSGWHPQRRNENISGQNMTRTANSNWKSDNTTTAWRGITYNLTSACEITFIRVVGNWPGSGDKGLTINAHRPGDSPTTYHELASAFNNSLTNNNNTVEWSGNDTIDQVSIHIQGIQQEIAEVYINCQQCTSIDIDWTANQQTPDGWSLTEINSSGENNVFRRASGGEFEANGHQGNPAERIGVMYTFSSLCSVNNVYARFTHNSGNSYGWIVHVYRNGAWETVASKSIPGGGGDGSTQTIINVSNLSLTDVEKISFGGRGGNRSTFTHVRVNA